MKILAVSYLFPNKMYPNYGVFVLNRLKAIHRHCDIVVINPIPWFPYSSKFKRYKNFNKIPRKEIIEGIEVYHPRFFIIPRFFKILDSLTFCISATSLSFKIFKYHKFELVDLHWTYPDILSGYVLSRFFNKKLMVTIRGKEALNHFTTDNSSSYYEEKSLRTSLLKYLLPKSDSIIVLSDELKNICGDYGVSPHKIQLITNGVSIDHFHYLGKNKARSVLNLPGNERILLCVGSLIYGKGFDRIIRSLPMINEKYSDVKLYIIGSEGPAGDYSQELKDLVQNYDLKNQIQFFGQVKNRDLIYWYNAADLFCLVSRSEGSPNVLTEALACGCPSVATDVGAVSDILKNDSLGMVISNEDSSVCAGIIEALSIQYNREQISEYMKQYSWDWCAKRVINQYIRHIGEQE